MSFLPYFPTASMKTNILEWFGRNMRFVILNYEIRKIEAVQMFG